MFHLRTYVPKNTQYSYLEINVIANLRLYKIAIAGSKDIVKGNNNKCHVEYQVNYLFKFEAAMQK